MNNVGLLSVLVFIIVLLLRFEIQLKNSKLRKLIMYLSKWRVRRLYTKQEYGIIAKRYRRASKLRRKRFLKENLLGLACIYEHDAKEAIEHFNSALEGAIGSNIYTIKSNLVIAYLQNKWYREALSLLEELRKEGHLPILPYTLALLISGKDNEARKFYENHQLRDLKDSGDLKKLLQFNPLKPEMLDLMKEILRGKSLWLYKPLIKDLIDKWEIDIFFNSINRYEILEKQAKNLLSEFEKQPALFNSPDVRYMRSAINMILPRISSYAGCSGLWGLVDNYDEFTLGLPIDEQLKNECVAFWRRLYRIISNTSNIETYNFEFEKVLIKEQIPLDAKNIVHGTSRCSLYASEAMNYVLRSIQINYKGFLYYYVDLVEKAIANKIVNDITPIMELISDEPSTKEVLEPLLYAFVSNRDMVTKSEIIDVFNKIPVSCHSKLQSLYKSITEPI